MPEFTYDPWTAVDVRSWMDPTGTAERPGAQDEPLGSKEKFWLTDPSGVSWLFKYARTGGVDNWVSGEDWAEVAVAELAVLIGVPTASVRLGLLDDCRGVLSRNLVPRGCKLEHGNELLSAIDPQYSGGRSGENERYTVTASAACLRNVAPPAGIAGVGELTAAFDMWAGYLVLDAWLAGTDRHDENWGAILDQSGRRYLAPSFDHGNALGFQVRPEEHRRLAHDDEPCLRGRPAVDVDTSPGVHD